MVSIFNFSYKDVVCLYIVWYVYIFIYCVICLYIVFIL